MLTTLAPRTVTTSGVAETREFSIKATGKAFKILIDGLYSDKILAPVREVSTNAYDSHIAAGCPERPFDLRLPTVFDPTFAVRDYGTSMTHHEIMDLYSTAFESSKDQSNTQVGKLGLGSMSPFAYSDSFNVTAWQNGEKRLYNAFIGSDYIPRISLMHTEPSDEPQGLEVSFSVRSGDSDKFADAVERILEGFDVKPNITGMALLVRTPPTVLFEGPGWKLCTSSYDAYCRARQGCVVYPIDIDSVPGLSDAARVLSGCDLLIDFPIGDLEIAASREMLGYDTITCANIRAKLEDIAISIQRTTQERVDALSTKAEVLSFVAEIRANFPTELGKLLLGLMWRGRSLAERADTRVLLKNLPIDYVASYALRRRAKPEITRAAGYHVIHGDALVYVHDTNKTIPGINARIVAHAKQFACNDIYIIRAPAGSMAQKRAFVKLGRPSIWVDTAALPSAASMRQRVPSAVKVWQYVSGSWNRVDTVEPGLFIVSHKDEWKTDFDDAEVQEWKVNQVIDNMHTLGLDPNTPIYRVPKTLKRVIKPDDGWRRLFDVAQEMLDERFDAAVVDKYQALANTLFCHSGLADPYEKVLSTVAETWLSRQPNSLSALYTYYHETKATWNDVCDRARAMIRLNVHMGYPNTVPEARHSAAYQKWPQAADPFLTEVELDYPALQHLSAAPYEVIEHYVKLCDERREYEASVNRSSSIELTAA